MDLLFQMFIKFVCSTGWWFPDHEVYNEIQWFVIKINVLFLLLCYSFRYIIKNLQFAHEKNCYMFCGAVKNEITLCKSQCNDDGSLALKVAIFRSFEYNIALILMKLFFGSCFSSKYKKIETKSTYTYTYKKYNSLLKCTT